MSQYTSQFTSLSPLVLTSQDNESKGCECGNSKTSITMNKFDPKDHELNSLMDNNKRWAAAVIKEDPEFFSDIANKQEPKLLWIGKGFFCITFYLLFTKYLLFKVALIHEFQVIQHVIFLFWQNY